MGVAVGWCGGTPVAIQVANSLCGIQDVKDDQKRKRPLIRRFIKQFHKEGGGGGSMVTGYAEKDIVKL